jgi:hypothetical protein
MEGSCSTGQSPQWAIVPVEQEEEMLNFQLFLDQLSLTGSDKITSFLFSRKFSWTPFSDVRNKTRGLADLILMGMFLWISGTYRKTAGHCSEHNS